MKYNDEVTPDNLGGLGGLPPYTEFERLTKELFAEAQRVHPDGGIILTYVAPGAQNIQHLGTQIINQGVSSGHSADRQSAETVVEKNNAPSIPSSDVMVKAIEKTVSDGLWATSTCWSVVYVVYRILGYEGSVSDFVRDVESWKFTRPLKYKCNRDSVGKPLRDKRMSFNLNRWLGDGVQKSFYLLAVALLDEVRKTFPSFPSDIPHLP